MKGRFQHLRLPQTILFLILTILFSVSESLVAQTVDTLSAAAGCANNQSTSGTWTVPCGVTSITVHVYGAGAGAGGGGGGSNGGLFNTRGGGGGGGGAYTSATINVTSGDVFNYSIGRGGCGGSNGGDGSSGGNGQDGGNSLFSGTDSGGSPVNLTASGGSRGTGGSGTNGSTGSGGAGGTGSGGTTNTSGTSGNSGSGASGGSGGNGAGPDGGSGGQNTNNPGSIYGGGGAGGGDSQGGIGAPGVVFITYSVTSGNTVGPASSSPSVCENVAITPVTHSTTGATGIGTPTGLPAGVTATWANDEIVISGTPTTAGTYNYTIPLAGGCGNVDATGTITVTNSNTAGAASSTPTVCEYATIPNVTHTTSGATGIGTPTGLPAGVTATWANDEIVISGTPTTAGTYNYTIPLTGGCGAAVNATGTITVNPSPTVNSIPDISACDGVNTQTTPLSGSVTGATYAWVNDNPAIGLGANGTGDIPAFTPTNTTGSPISANITVVAVANGCTSAVEVFTVTVSPTPTASFTAIPDSVVIPNANVVFTNTSQNATSWDWTFGDGNSASTENTSHNYTTSGSQTVTLVAHYGQCSDTATTVVSVTGMLGIPNIFTPNNDGVNDFVSFDQMGAAQLEVFILNRWGAIVFKTTDPNVSWDGITPLGLKSPEGVYFYLVRTTDANGEKQDHTGTITLVR